MKFASQLKFTGAALALAALFAGPAQAQSSWTWQLDAQTPAPVTCTSPSPGNTFGNASECTSQAGNQKVTVSAWSSAQGTLAERTNHDWHSAELTPQGANGFGAGNRDTTTEGLNAGSPNHAVDNISGNYDFIMVQFSSAMILNQFGVGWGAGDSDATVMRWTGAAAPTKQNSGASLVSTIGTGAWAFVNDYADVCKGSTGSLVSGNCNAANSQVNVGASQASSYWLIAAYNTTMSSLDGFHSQTDDGFKLNFLRATHFSCPNGSPNAGGGCGGTSTGVPEPTSLALAAAALLGAGYTRRRKRA